MEFEPGSDSAIRVVQISDCHLGSDQSFTLAGINTYNSFSNVLAEIKDHKQPPSLIAVTGDIASEGDGRTYQLFSQSMKASQLPYAWLPGNHDDFSVMTEVMDQPFTKAVELGNWVVIFLVSAVPGEVGGVLAEAELVQLGHLLRLYSDRYTLLFVHHPPSKIDCKWLDEQRIANHETLAELLVQHNAQHKNLRAIFSGHVHQESESVCGGLPVYSTPSTCVQFASGSDTFALSDQAPGYRWIDLCGDGTINTGVERLQYDMQAMDQSCIGY